MELGNGFAGGHAPWVMAAAFAVFFLAGLVKGVVGLLTGAISAATGVFVVPAVPYLQALGLQRDALIQAMGLSFTVSTLALAVALVLNDSYPLRVAGESLLLLAPALLGMWAGQHLRQAMSPALFRRCFLLGLALLGLHMAWRPWLD